MNLDLFEPEAQDNLLPYDGVVKDFGLILDHEQSQKYLNYFLQHLAWQHDEVYLHGQYYKTERKVVWYGDQQYGYAYSGTLKQAQPWERAVWDLKQQIEALIGDRFNSCLVNLYPDGTQGMGWHSDDEAHLSDQRTQETVIASLSLGATRKFSFKHKNSAAKVDLCLHSGQLIVMRGQTQRNWRHTLRKSTRVLQPRINLTFRYFF